MLNDTLWELDSMILVRDVEEYFSLSILQGKSIGDTSWLKILFNQDLKRFCFYDFSWKQRNGNFWFLFNFLPTLGINEKEIYTFLSDVYWLTRNDKKNWERYFPYSIFLLLKNLEEGNTEGLSIDFTQENVQEFFLQFKDLRFISLTHRVVRGCFYLLHNKEEITVKKLISLIGLTPQLRTRRDVNLILSVFSSVFRCYTDDSGDSYSYIPLISFSSHISKKNKVFQFQGKGHFKKLTRGKKETLSYWVGNPRLYLFLSYLEVSLHFWPKTFREDYLLEQVVWQRSCRKEKLRDLSQFLSQLELNEICKIKKENDRYYFV